MFRTINIVFLIVCLVASNVSAANTLVGRLDNGMDIVLVENHSVPMIAANLIVKAGARDETWQTWGAAHFLEHLLFNGTKNRTQEEIYAAFDRIGAYHNAHTGSHFTDFMVLTAQENFTTGFDILADMVFNSTLPPPKFEKERGIVEEEIARSNTAGGDDGNGVSRLLFGGSPLSRDVLGTTESIASLDRDSVIAFYQRWYTPNNSILFATGDFSADTLFDWFQKRLAAYPPRQLPPRAHIAPPDWEKLAGLGQVVHESNGKRRSVSIAMAAPSPSSPDFVPLMMQLRALDRRFEVELPAGVNGGTDLQLDPDLGVIHISIEGPKDGPSATDLIALLDKELNRLAEKAPTKDEISRLARAYLAEQVYNTERLHYYGMMYSPYWAVVGWDEFASWERRLPSVTTEELTGATKRWLLSKQRLTYISEPAKAAEAEAARDTVITIKSTPEGGPTVIVRSDPSARVFAVHILAKDRWLWDAVYGVGTVDLLHRTLGEAAGSGQKIGDKLETLSATLKCADEPGIPYDDYYTSPDFSFFRFEVLPESWNEGVTLLAELLEATPMTDDLLKSARESADAGKSASGRSPVGAGSGKLHEHLVGGTSLSASVYGDTKKITVADLQKLREAYLNPENLVITIAGPMDANAASETVIKAFKEKVKVPLKRPDGWAEETRVIRSLVGNRDTLTLGRPQGAVVMGEVIKDIPDSIRAALTIANAYFSDQMSEVLRETRGLAYSLGSSVSIQRAKDGSLWGLWEISIGTRPEKLVEAESGIRELLDELKTHKFTADEVQRLSASIAGRLMMRDMARIGQAYAMGVGEFFWSDPDSRAKLVTRLRDLTPEQVEAAAKWLEAERLMTIIVK